MHKLILLWSSKFKNGQIQIFVDKLVRESINLSTNISIHTFLKLTFEKGQICYKWRYTFIDKFKNKSMSLSVFIHYWQIYLLSSCFSVHRITKFTRIILMNCSSPHFEEEIVKNNIFQHLNIKNFLFYRKNPLNFRLSR